MKKLYWLAPVAGAAALAGVLALQPKFTKAEPKNEAAAGPAATNLPVKTVVLFSSGVGYFQRAGDVDGSTRVDLTFQVRDINDLIKSMVIQDKGGSVSAVSYDSLDPVDRTLKSFAVNLTGNPTLGSILEQLRGEKVEVVLSQTAANSPGTVTGSIMGLEKQHVVTKEGATDAEVLNMWCTEGVRSFKLNDVQRLRFLNPAMEQEFRRALDTLAQSHDAQKKAVSISFDGQGKREVRVGYVVENPIWKTSYRLVLDKDGKPFLQGWAVVDNPSDDDWNGVGMSLISGRPVSFQMDLYQPLYVPRPMVDLDLFQSLRPVAYGGAIGDQDKAAALAADGGVRMRNATRGMAAAEAMPAKPAAPGGGPAMGYGSGGGGFGGGAGMGVNAPQNRRFAEEMEKSLAARLNLQQGVQNAANASQLGDFFQYTIKTPVNLPRQKSALLPIANSEIEATRLSIYNPAVHPKFPMLGLKLKNTTGLHLMQGPITVFEGSTYAGDARVNDLPQNDERLISYAVDLGTEIEAKSQFPPQRLTNVQIQHGLILRTDRQREEKTYTATNRGDQGKTLWIEHPYRAEFHLVSEQKPVERTSDVYRFEMKLPAEAKKSASITVTEERDVNTQIALNNLDDGSIRFFINTNVSSDGVKDALKKFVDLKAKLNGTRQELGTVNEQIKSLNEEQDRMRKNMDALPRDSAAYKRLTGKFDKQETEIEGLRDQQKKLQQQELKDRQAVDGYLQNLNVK
jgi:hypothetical protein